MPTTYQRAAAEYDPQHESALVDAIMTAIAEESRVTDANALVLRTAESAAALVNVLSFILAVSPAVVRSPTAIRRTVDGLHKKLRQRVAAAEKDADVQDFRARVFTGTDTGGTA
jgi:hypothetical protein